jgi:hypothetical protein
LGTLPDLDLATSTKDTNSHCGKQVVGGVGMVVDTSIEDGSCILSNASTDQGLSTWVLLDEVGYIVNDTSDCNESTTVLGFGLIVVPVDDWQLLKRNTPVEGLPLLVKLLLELLETTLLDFVLLELLKIVGESELLVDPDEPLGRVVLVPLDSIAVIGWELVVEIVVSLSESNESSDNMITRGVSVIERLVTEPMGKGVDTEGGLLNDEDSENTSVDEASHPISPSETSNQAREDHSHEDNSLDVVSVLPDDNWIIVQIGDVGTANSLWVLLHDHPSNVRVEETLSDRVWILVGIGVSVVGSVISGPPSDRTLDSSTTDGSEEDLEREGSRVGGVCP